jgi:hypothetical protein
MSYVVMDENVLGYLLPNGWLGILATKPSAVVSWKDGPIHLGRPTRPATLEDFAFFRVCPKGHIS